MFKRILVAVDGSPTAKRGFKTALALAADQGATLYVAHVIENAALAASDMDTGYVPAEFVEALWQSSRDAGRKVLDRAQAAARKQGHDIVPVLVENQGVTVADAIVGQARKVRADLIVLGTHGRRGLRRAVLGSDAEGVVSAAKVPVLLVRAPTP